MKLKIGNKVYLQKYDVAHITHYCSVLPIRFLDETFFGSGSDGYFSMGGPDKDAFDFGIVYENPGNVAWLMEQTWIADFETFAKMPLDELEELQERLKLECSTNAEEFDAKSDEYRKEHVDEKIVS